MCSEKTGKLDVTGAGVKGHGEGKAVTQGQEREMRQPAKSLEWQVKGFGQNPLVTCKYRWLQLPGAA